MVAESVFAILSLAIVVSGLYAVWCAPTPDLLVAGGVAYCLGMLFACYHGARAIIGIMGADARRY